MRALKIYLSMVHLEYLAMGHAVYRDVELEVTVHLEYLAVYRDADLEAGELGNAPLGLGRDHWDRKLEDEGLWHCSLVLAGEDWLVYATPNKACLPH